ncbi:hypothetical protein HG537_0E02480 [Torulaspora globosa]|uniref:Replication protein A C-terminal domain-containing protein n=1 Tax=Torulaspora globosa TaxID=48254 RepID=A0A7H9HUH6_9SACH|nr:hypothetical protein HG537_0E02480 [Torulaspora sp. CBS 2947]
MELHHVCFVGVIRNIIDDTGSIKVTVEDGTGQINVRKYSLDTNDIEASQDEETKKHYTSSLAQQYQIGTYVKVFGALREFNGERGVQFAVIKNIKSFNEVIAHHLEAMKLYAIATGKFTTSKVGTEMQKETAPSLFVKDTDSNDGGNPLQRILAFCRQQCAGQDPNNFSVPVELIMQTLNLDETTVVDCCNTLTEQGFIYPTMNERKFFAMNA